MIEHILLKLGYLQSYEEIMKECFRWIAFYIEKRIQPALNHF